MQLAGHHACSECALSSVLQACRGAPGDAWSPDYTTMLLRWRRPGWEGAGGDGGVLRSGGEGGVAEETGGTETGLVRRPSTRSLGVGEEMGVTGKGNCKRVGEGQDEGLLGKETGQKSAPKSGRWSEMGREEGRNKLHTKPGMQPRCLTAAVSLLPMIPWGSQLAEVSYPSARAGLAKNPYVIAQSWVCQLPWQRSVHGR